MNTGSGETTYVKAEIGWERVIEQSWNPYSWAHVKTGENTQC